MLFFRFLILFWVAMRKGLNASVLKKQIHLLSSAAAL